MNIKFLIALVGSLVLFGCTPSAEEQCAKAQHAVALASQSFYSAQCPGCEREWLKAKTYAIRWAEKVCPKD